MKDAMEVLTGTDLVTGQKLSGTDRLITVAAAFIPFVGASALRKITSKVAEAGRAADRAAGVAANVKVIGHFPEYVELSKELGTKPFSVPKGIWDKMTAAEKWAANQKFLDRAAKAGKEFILATPIEQVRPGSFYEKEIEYLLSQGYNLAKDASRLIR